MFHVLLHEVTTMQPSPWDDDSIETNDPAAPQSIQMNAPMAAQDPFSTQPVEMQQPMIMGTTAQMPAYGQQPLYIQQTPSSAAKVIGIILVIFGAFNLIGLIGVFGPQTDLTTGEEIIVSNSSRVLLGLNTFVSLVGFVLAGVWMTQYRRKGLHLALLTIGVTYLIGILTVAVGGNDGGFGEIMGDGAALGATAVLEGLCSGICGLIVAIPILSGANHGLDDSRLFG